MKFALLALTLLTTTPALARDVKIMDCEGKRGLIALDGDESGIYSTDRGLMLAYRRISMREDQREIVRLVRVSQWVYKSKEGSDEVPTVVDFSRDGRSAKVEMDLKGSASAFVGHCRSNEQN